jgi:hypothetical protein
MMNLRTKTLNFSVGGVISPASVLLGRLHRFLCWSTLTFASLSLSGESLELNVGETEVELRAPASLGNYYGLQFSPDLGSFDTIDLTLGSPAPIWAVDREGIRDRAFFRAETISLFAPRDTDGDGMDDLWELTQAHLDPLDPLDATLASPNIAGISNLQEYLQRFGLENVLPPQFYSRELSVFNFGASSAPFEGLSREWTVFNFGAVRTVAQSREISIWNALRDGDLPALAGFPQVYSRELSLYNFGSPPFSVEARGRELTVFNGERPATPGFPQIYSRELSVFNFGAPTAAVEAISREVTVFNDLPQS